VISLIWFPMVSGAKRPYKCEHHVFYMSHGINTLLITIDMFVVAVPMRLLHFVYPLLAGTVYICFS
jgi:hypothetical protein